MFGMGLLHVKTTNQSCSHQGWCCKDWGGVSKLGHLKHLKMVEMASAFLFKSGWWMIASGVHHGDFLWLETTRNSRYVHRWQHIYTCNVRPPSYKLVYKPSNYTVISTINHSDIGVMFTNLDIKRGPHIVKCHPKVLCSLRMRSLNMSENSLTSRLNMWWKILSGCPQVEHVVKNARDSEVFYR